MMKIFSLVKLKLIVIFNFRACVVLVTQFFSYTYQLHENHFVLSSYEKHFCAWYFGYFCMKCQDQLLKSVY